MPPHRSPRNRPPLDADSLRELGLTYVARYATSRARLLRYLERKLIERGWAGETVADPAAVADRMAALGFIDDRAFAEARSRSLQRRGFGVGRVRQALYAAGIDRDDYGAALEIDESEAWQAAIRFAQRRRLGPWSNQPLDRKARDRQLASLLRAGHDSLVSRRIMDIDKCVDIDNDFIQEF